MPGRFAKWQPRIGGNPLIPASWIKWVSTVLNTIEFRMWDQPNSFVDRTNEDGKNWKVYLPSGASSIFPFKVTKSGGGGDISDFGKIRVYTGQWIRNGLVCELPLETDKNYKELTTDNSNDGDRYVVVSLQSESGMAMTSPDAELVVDFLNPDDTRLTVYSNPAKYVIIAKVTYEHFATDGYNPIITQYQYQNIQDSCSLQPFLIETQFGKQLGGATFVNGGQVKINGDRIITLTDEFFAYSSGEVYIELTGEYTNDTSITVYPTAGTIKMGASVPVDEYGENKYYWLGTVTDDGNGYTLTSNQRIVGHINDMVVVPDANSDTEDSSKRSTIEFNPIDGESKKHLQLYDVDNETVFPLTEHRMPFFNKGESNGGTLGWVSPDSDVVGATHYSTQFVLDGTQKLQIHNFKDATGRNVEDNDLLIVRTPIAGGYAVQYVNQASFRGQDGADGQDWDGSCDYCNTSGYATNVAPFCHSDLLCRDVDDDSHPDIYIYQEGDAARNHMSGAIGDAGGTISVDPNNRVLNGYWENDIGFDITAGNLRLFTGNIEVPNGNISVGNFGSSTTVIDSTSVTADIGNFCTLNTCDGELNVGGSIVLTGSNGITMTTSGNINLGAANVNSDNYSGLLSNVAALQTSGTPANWSTITGDQSVVNVSGFTNDSGYIGTTLTSNINTNEKSFIHVSNVTTDNSATGEIVNDILAAVDIDFPQLVRIDTNGKWAKVDANAVATCRGLLGMALSNVSANNVASVLIKGFVRDDDWTWATLGAPIYAANVAGNLSQTLVNGEDDVVLIVGTAIHADRMFFNPIPVTVEYKA